MELFKAPPIMIINIKRFKTGKNSMRYSMWGSGGGEKIES